MFRICLKLSPLFVIFVTATALNLRSAGGVQDRNLEGFCESNFYETTLGFTSENSLECSDAELNDFQVTLEALYNEVLALDRSLSGFVFDLDTTLCLFDPEPEEEILRKLTSDRNLALIKYTILFKGFGLCRLCPVDNGDRRLTGQMRERLLQESIVYEVIDFSVNGEGNPLGSFVPVKSEWRGSHGMLVRAANSTGGFTPNRKAFLFDTANPGPGNRTSFGSPNSKCPDGGPGIGYAGEPSQPGENCAPQKNVLIIQHNEGEFNIDNSLGGVLLFSFDSPTRIGHVGVMGIPKGNGSFITVLTEEKVKINIPFEGLGENSVQLVHVGNVVRNLRVVLSGPGAVTEIGIFSPTTAAEALSYRFGQSYTASVSLFQEYIPYLEFDLSYYLTRRLNKLFGSIVGGCLYNKWVEVDVTLKRLPALPIVSELKCGSTWTQCPSEMTGDVIQYECVPGLHCPYHNDTSPFECDCGTHKLFTCYALTSPATGSPLPVPSDSNSSTYFP